jgi:hypothetical protein
MPEKIINCLERDNKPFISEYSLLAINVADAISDSSQTPG